MEFGAQMDIYCERLGPGLWAEPLNAVTNLAFLVAAAAMAWRLRGTRLPLAWALVAILAAIGVGSGLFHTFATGWAALADVVPIAAFILVYCFALHRDLLGLPLWAALASLPGFLAFAALTGTGFAALPFFQVSAGYWPVPLALLLYALATARPRPAVARGLALGAAILTVSLIARSVDLALCDTVSIGTHFLWHILNAVMLGWMIEHYRRQMLAAPGARG